jgi:hypothetical protein
MVAAPPISPLKVSTIESVSPFNVRVAKPVAGVVTGGTWLPPFNEAM